MRALKNHQRFAWIIAAGFAVGCSNAPQPPTPNQKQDAILADPMNYKPDVGRDVSGGDVGHLDQGSLNKDLNDFFNP